MPQAQLNGGGGVLAGLAVGIGFGGGVGSSLGSSAMDGGAGSSGEASSAGVGCTTSTDGSSATGGGTASSLSWPRKIMSSMMTITIAAPAIAMVLMGRRRVGFLGFSGGGSPRSNGSGVIDGRVGSSALLLDGSAFRWAYSRLTRQASGWAGLNRTRVCSGITRLAPVWGLIPVVSVTRCNLKVPN